MAVSRRQRPEDLAGSLAQFEFFKGIRKSELDEIAGLALCHDYPKNNILSYRGDPTGAVFMVISGRVKTILTNDEGREVIVSLLGPGGIFGLTAAVDGGEQLCSAVTVQRSTVARFGGKSFLRWTENSPGGRGALARELARNVRDLNQKIEAHALMSTKARLLDTLLDIADAEGEQEPDGTRISFTRPTHKELANRMGTSRDVVSRLLAELRDAQMFEADEGRVILVPMSALVLRED
jgi:CRP/FNR family cyclic AMP-dependent transcriptional regulator